jgi:hypothetical protein
MTIWSLADDQTIGCQSHVESRDLASQDLALLISVADDARPAF